jgi:hypothetical protein
MSRRRRGRGLPRWAWWFVVGFPALFLVAGIGLLIEAAIFQSEAENARGRVIDVDANYDSDGGVSYRPLIRYRRADGRSFEAETHIASSGYDYRIGERVDILYSRDDPGTVRINSLFSLYGIGLIMAAIGGLFVCILMFVRKRMFRQGAGVSARIEEAGAGVWRTEADAQAEPGRDPEPRTTDPSKYGHAHKPKPEQPPTIRRMR